MLTFYRFAAVLCCLAAALQVHAQDTTVIQTLQWEDNFRAGYYDFPEPDGTTYRKILMYYNMRCHDAAINPGDNSQGCGEWDYSCNTFITDTTRVDSAKATHPSHIISNFSGDQFSYTTQPTYSYIQHPQYLTSINITAETAAAVGTENTDLALSTSAPENKMQFLYTADELTTAGLSPGDVHRLKLKVNNTSPILNLFKIKLKNIDETVLDPANPHTDGFTEVFHQNMEFWATGNQLFNFYQPFTWEDGKNILVEISYTPPTPAASDFSLAAEETMESMTLAHHSTDQSAYFNRNGYYELNTANIQGTYDEITIAFWAYGDPDIMPQNNSIIECSTDLGRQVNIHLPWSNGQVYWDCGNLGSGYNRINKPANPSDYEGNWTHWTFTKNTATGSMKIYLNGQEWHSGTGMTNAINLDEKFIIGSAVGVNSYYGKMDDLSIWKKELDATAIQNLMHTQTTTEHPDFADLLSYFDFEDLNSSGVSTLSNYSVTADRSGQPFAVAYRSEDVFKHFTALNKRPTTTFYQGTYELDNTILYFDEEIPVEPNTLTTYIVDASNNLVADQVDYVYESGYQYTTSPDGTIVDSVFYAAEASVDITTLQYFNKFPAKYEILSLVTPYGFFIDLTPQGKTFVFDVTDYAPILQGSKRLSIEMGGQNQEELDIKFLFIEGTPEREVLDIQNIWPFRRVYPGGLADQSYMEPRDIALQPYASHYKIRSTITGHGQNGEFIPQEHYINLNGGSKEFNYEVWKYCGQNPIYPQGGTWIFDRAGWCPGSPSDVHIFNLDEYVEPGEIISLDYGLNTSSGSSENYLVSNQLVTYGAYNFNLDASIERILSPDDLVEQERRNPSCNEAEIEIKNTGSSTLTSITIAYEVIGGPYASEETFNLDLSPGESQVLNLPIGSVAFYANGLDTGTFQASIVSVNGQADDYSDNNQMKSTFKQVDTFNASDQLLIRLQTNNRASENSYRILDNAGNVVLNRDNMTNSTLYKDEMNLIPGCYTLVFEDSGNDGLDFWYWDVVGQNVGVGGLAISKQINDFLDIAVKVFNPDFGGTLYYDFVIGDITDTEEIQQNSLFSVYPNPTSDMFHIELQGLEGQDMVVKLLDMSGKLIQQEQVNHKTHDWSLQWSIDHLKAGMYLIQIITPDQQFAQTIVKQ